MSCFISPVQEIEDLRFEPFPSKPVAVVKAFYNGRSVVALGANGTIYTNAVKASACYGFGLYAFTDSLFKTLQKLGVLTKAAVDQHLAKAKTAEERRNTTWRAENILRDAEALKLPLTKAQKRTLKMIKEAK